MNNIMVMVLTILINFIILITTAVESIYKKNKYNKKYEYICDKFIKRLDNIDKSIYNELKKIFDEGDGIVINESNRIEYICEKNKLSIGYVMEVADEFFDMIYKDKKMYSNIRIYKDGNFFPLVHKNYQKYPIKECVYSINKNTDLETMFRKRCALFIISNIRDYKKIENYAIQNRELERLSKAMISISLENETGVIGCYTIYFSKPLNDTIQIKIIEEFITALKIKLTELVIEYMKINNGLQD